MRARWMAAAVALWVFGAACGGGSDASLSGSASGHAATSTTDNEVPSAPLVSSVDGPSDGLVTDPEALPPQPLADDPDFDLEAIVREIWALRDHAYNTSNPDLFAAIAHPNCACWADVQKLRDRRVRGEHTVGEHTTISEVSVVKAEGNDVLLLEIRQTIAASYLEDSEGRVIDTFDVIDANRRMAIQHDGTRWLWTGYWSTEESA